MSNSTITLANLLRELQSFVSCSDAAITAAEKSGINTKNSKELKEYAEAWSDGEYDEDPDLLVSELLSLIG